MATLSELSRRLIQRMSDAGPYKVLTYLRKDPRGQLLEIHCKLCYTDIAGLVEVETRRDRENGTPRTVLVQRFQYFPNYKEIKIKFDDGTSHITNICSQCLQQLKKEELEVLYLSDIIQLNEEHKNKAMPERDFEFMLNRFPLDYEVIEDAR
jgi:hypothetical protein